MTQAIFYDMICDPDEFVNRDHELRVFADLLCDHRCRLLLITGVPSIGKSCLLHRMLEHCQRQGFSTALVDFRNDPELTRPERILESLSIQLSGPFAEQMVEAEVRIREIEAAFIFSQTFTHGVTTHAESATLQGKIEVAGDLVEQKIQIVNSPITIHPGAGPQRLVDVIEDERDRHFRTALSTFQTAHPLVLFFDHFEEAAEQVACWFRSRILNLYREAGGTCHSLWLVIAGRQVPLQSEVNQWRNLLQQQQIGPLPPQAIYLYWVEKRRLDPTSVSIIVNACGGNPGLLAAMADNTEQALKRE